MNAQLSRAEAEEEALRLSTAALSLKVEKLQQETERVEQEVVEEVAMAAAGCASRDEAKRKLDETKQR